MLGAIAGDIIGSVYENFHMISEIRPNYRTDLTCQGSTPEAIIAFLVPTDFEDAIRNAASLSSHKWSALRI
jgi:ADP-ribosylglycohydrolase